MSKFYLPPDGLYDQDLNRLGDAVIKLHDAARLLEYQGHNGLGEEVRKLADKVSASARHY